MERRRLLHLALAGLLFIAKPLYSEVFRLNDLAGGMNDSVPGNMIQDNEAVSITNFHVDTDSRGLLQRDGSRKQNTTQLSGKSAVDVFSHVKANGSSYLISIASATVAYSTDNGSNWTNLITTATINAVWDGAGFLDDNFYMTNQNDGGWSFSGTAFVPVGSMPGGKFIENYQNRLFVANTSLLPYRLFFSGLLQPSTWTTTTDYFDFPEAITAIGKPVDGGLPIYTANTTWMLRGTGSSNFYLTQISGNIGCSDNRTVQNIIVEGQEFQVFFSLGPNGSRKNLFGLLGDKLVPLGERIPETLDDVSVFDTSARFFDWDSSDDFSEGTTSHTYVSSSANAVKLSTWTDTDTTTGTFINGTVSNTTVTYNNGSRVMLSTDNANVLNNSFEDGTGGDADNWTEEGTTARGNSHAAQDGSYYMAGVGGIGDASSSLHVAILDSSGAGLSTTTYTFSDFTINAWVQKSINLSSYVGRNIRIKFSGSTLILTTGAVTSDLFFCSGTTFTFYGWRTFSPGPLTHYISVDLAEGGRSSVVDGTYLSRTFDTALSSPAWIATGSGFIDGSHTVLFETQSSADGSSFNSLVTWSTGSSPVSPRERYIRYKVTFSTKTDGVFVPYVSDVTLSARESSGTFVSEVEDGGSDISAWNTFNVSTSGYSGHSFYYRTNASSTSILTGGWTSISPGGDVSGGARYFQWMDVFSISAASDDPTIERVTQHYTASSGSIQPADSVVWDDEYWLTYTTTGTSYNNAILVMNREGKFSKFSGLNVYGFGIINRILIGGDSISDGVNGGYVRQLDVGTTDDGTAVNASVTLKHQEFPNLQDYRKLANQVYFSYGVDSGTFTATALENFSDASNTYTVRFATGNTVGRWKLELKPGTATKQLGLKFDNSYPGSQLRLYPPITVHFQPQKLIPEGSGAP